MLPMAKSATEKMRTYRQNLRRRGMKLLATLGARSCCTWLALAERDAAPVHAATNRHSRAGSDTDWVEELGAFDDQEE